MFEKIRVYLTERWGHQEKKRLQLLKETSALRSLTDYNSTTKEWSGESSSTTTNTRRTISAV